MARFDQAWLAEVTRLVDPVFQAADVGFVRQLLTSKDGDIAGVLWEADPERFAARYPDSGIVESYGEEQWPQVACIDYWLHLEEDPPRGRISCEGWNLDDNTLELTGDAGDAELIAEIYRHILHRQADDVAARQSLHPRAPMREGSASFGCAKR